MVIELTRMVRILYNKIIKVKLNTYFSLCLFQMGIFQRRLQRACWSLIGGIRLLYSHDINLGISYLLLNTMPCINTKLSRHRFKLSLPFCLKQMYSNLCLHPSGKNIQFLYSICRGKSFAEPKKSDLHSISYSMQIFPKSGSFICKHFLKDLVTMGSDGFWSKCLFMDSCTFLQDSI